MPIPIRAVVPLSGLETIRARRGVVSEKQLTNGPGKLGQAFVITGEHDGMRATARSPLRLLGATAARGGRVEIAPRIGIGRAVDWPLRYVLRDFAIAGGRAR